MKVGEDSFFNAFLCLTKFILLYPPSEATLYTQILNYNSIYGI